MTDSTVATDDQIPAVSEDPMEIDEQAATAAQMESTAILEQLKATAPRLPISKVKRIARTDPEYMITASNAFTATAFATELFVQSLTEETMTMAYLTSKSANTKSIRLGYNQLSDCISRKENFQFLEDVVPKTKNLRMLVKENKVRYTTTPEGQSRLPFTEKQEQSSKPDEDEDDEGLEIDDHIEEEEDEGEDEGEEVKDPEVEEQLKEVEQMNRVPDLPDDDKHSDEEQTDQEDEDGATSRTAE